jgi:hypothetical protein
MSKSKTLKKKFAGISMEKRLVTWNETEKQNGEKGPSEKENLPQEQNKVGNVCIV